MFILKVFEDSFRITILVFLMMIVIDFVDVRTQGYIRRIVKGGIWRQYSIASFLGVTPGCVGAYMNVTLYIHGFLSFGAIVGGMIATSGDEAFVMLARFPLQALMLFGILFMVAIPLGWLSDLAAKKMRFTPQDCELHEIHEEEKISGHYLKEHVWKHIVKKHIWRVFLWTFCALLLVNAGLEFWELDGFVKEHMGLVLVLSILIGIIPASGPHMVFVMLFADGLIPFSVLLTSSIAQDGHGMLPLMSYTFRDSILIKGFNVAAAVLVGGAAYLLGW